VPGVVAGELDQLDPLQPVSLVDGPACGRAGGRAALGVGRGSYRDGVTRVGYVEWRLVGGTGVGDAFPGLVLEPASAADATLGSTLPFSPLPAQQNNPRAQNHAW
jgi:hypothetical protein